MKRKQFEPNLDYEDDYLDRTEKSFRKTKFKPEIDYPQDMLTEKIPETSEETQSSLLSEINYFKELNKNQLDDVKDMISSIETAIKTALIENPDLTYEEIEEVVFNLINNNIIPGNSPTKNDLFLFKTIEEVLKKPDIISSIISTQDMKEYLAFNEGPYSYTSKISDNYSSLLKDAFYNLQPIFTDDIKQKMLSHTLSDSEKKLIQNDVCKFIKNYHNKAFDIIIKKGYIQRIINCTKILDFCGLLHKNNTVNNYRLTYLGLEFLGYNYYENNEDTSIKRPHISMLMDENYIKHFSTEELTALSAFYCNRLAKCTLIYNDILYVLYKTDTLRKIYDNPKYTLNISDEELNNILVQHQLFKKPAKLYMDKQAKKQRKEFSDVYFYEDINSAEISSVLNKYSANYQNEFSQLLPDYQHDILKDYEKAINLQSTVNYAYSMKKHSLESLLLMLIDQNNERNWGIVLEKLNKSKYDKDKNNGLLIGIDMKEFNMPIKLHCGKEQIEEFLTNYTGKALIPVYRGSYDFVLNNSYFSTQILFKLSKEQRRALHKKVEEVEPTDKIYKLINHLQWMSHPNRKPEFITGPKLYYDLKTEQIVDEKDIDK